MRSAFQVSRHPDVQIGPSDCDSIIPRLHQDRPTQGREPIVYSPSDSTAPMVGDNSPLGVAKRELALWGTWNNGQKMAAIRKYFGSVKYETKGEWKPWVPGDVCKIDNFKECSSWCMAFVSFCCEASGKPLLNTWISPQGNSVNKSGFTSVSNCYKYYQGQGKIQKEPKPGAIFLMSHRLKDGENLRWKHTGFVDYIVKTNPLVLQCIEGNISRKLSNQRRETTVQDIQGYLYI